MKTSSGKISKISQLIAGIVLVSFLSFSFLFAFSQPAQGQMVVSEQVIAGVVVKKEIKESFGKLILSSLYMALASAVDQFAQKFAYDLAANLATLGAGGNPLFFIEHPKEYFSDVALDAAGDFIGTLAESWGVNLCAPRLPNIALGIPLGLAERFQPPKPKCEWSQIVSNWQAFSREVKNPKEVLRHVSVSFKDPTQTDVGQIQEVHGLATREVAEALRAKIFERAEGSGVKSRREPISERSKGSAETIKKLFQNLGPNLPYSSEYKVLETAANLDYHVFGMIGKNFFSVLVNTLASKLLQRGIDLVSSKIRNWLAKDQSPDLRSLATQVGARQGRAPGGPSLAEAAKLSFAEFLTPTINITSWDVLSELSSCPKDKPETATMFQCVIDEGFAQAIRSADMGQPLTVKEAVEKGYLNLQKIFGFKDPGSNLEPTVDEGYSYSALKKLRLLRIIPIGWELAALKAKETGKAVTFQDVFGSPDNPNFYSTSSPYYGLIDPNWILKAPLTQCGAKGWGALTDGYGGRQEVCADIQHCLKEDDKGKCLAWGYCTKEKNVWRIDGDACQAQYASCETYQRIDKGPGASELSLLENTLDFGTCNVDNAGCRWYSSWATKSDMSQWDENKRLYLDGDTEQCEAAASGCTEFILASKAQANLIFNPSFEKDEDNNGKPDNWHLGNSSDWQYFDEGYFGSKSLKTSKPAVRIFQPDIPIKSSTSYTFSVYAKASEGGGKMALDIWLKDKDGNRLSIQDIINQLGNGWTKRCQSGNNYKCAAYHFNLTTDWQRYSAVFTIPASLKVEKIDVGMEMVENENRVETGGENNVFFDGVQLEEGGIATEFKEGYGQTPPQTVYLRKPPEWLGCDGEEGEPMECANYARVCRPEEVGCERYTPTNGDPAVAGIVTDLDRCPAECVGYASYKQEASNFEPAIFPEYLIPSQAAPCDLAEVGCSQFTNLANEAVEYYSYLRACQKPLNQTTNQPNPDNGIYYTWQGAEKTGYQLQSWNLKRSNLTLTPTSSWQGSCNPETKRCEVKDKNNKIIYISQGFCEKDLDCQVDVLPPGSTKAVPPCTNIDALKDPPTCTDTLSNQAICTAADVGVNPDCRAFYDKAGNIYYRLYSKTVLVTDDCTKYRITVTGLTIDNQATCEKYGGSWKNNRCEYNGAPVSKVDHLFCLAGHGSWDEEKSQCVYAGSPSESTSCPASANSCRLFTGNAGANVQTILGPETFESGTNEWTNAVISTEASSLGGHSLKVAGSDKGTDTHRPLFSLNKGENYIVSLWVKGEAGKTVKLKTYLANYNKTENNNSVITGKVESLEQILKPDWQLLNFGPLKVNFELSSSSAPLSPTQGPQLGFVVTGGTAYLDNIILRQVKDQIPLLKNSLRIPPSCDRLPAALGGGYSPQAMLGCAEYTDRANQTHYLKSFSSFCRDSAVGCQELIDTYNSTEMESKAWNTQNTGVCRGEGGKSCCFNPKTKIYEILDSCPEGYLKLCAILAGKNSCAYGPTVTRTASDLPVDNLTVPYDKHVYLVVDNKKMCKREDKGCQALGYQDPVKGNWTTVYLKNNPDKYNQILCRYEEDGCAAWSSREGNIYFKDPSARLCVWKNGIEIGGVKYSGWFKKEEEEVVLTTTTSGVTNVANFETNCTQSGGTWKKDDQTCHLKLSSPCYGKVNIEVKDNNILLTPSKDAYLMLGSVFGIYRNFDPKFEGRAGECPTEQAGCTEFIDPTDKSDQYPQGRPYYYFDNEKIDKKSCQGNVSRQEGCVLFNQTDIPEKPWSAQETYQLSESNNGKLVAPRSASQPENNDANVILKVRRDRECAEWLTCASSNWVFDTKKSQWKAICSSLARCNQLPLSFEEGNTNQCVSPVSSKVCVVASDPQKFLKSCFDNSDCAKDCQSNNDCVIWLPGGNKITYQCDSNTKKCKDNSQCQIVPLSSFLYKERDKSWNGQEYSGYSLPNYFPVEDLIVSQLGNNDWRLVKMVDSCGKGDEGAVCQKNILGQLITGRCYGQKCLTSPQGEDPLGNIKIVSGKIKIAVEGGAPAPMCRLYPESDSPFPSTKEVEESQLYTQAKKCNQKGNPFACECNYTKLTYGTGEARYADYQDPNLGIPKVGNTEVTFAIPAGLCQGSPAIDGKACQSNADCQIKQGNDVDSGTCSKLAKKASYLGWQGFCLEKDESRVINGDPNQHPCLTWLPVTQAAGVPDLYNQYREAGFVPNPSEGLYGQFYCQAEGALRRLDNDCGDKGGPCNKLREDSYEKELGSLSVSTNDGGQRGVSSDIIFNGTSIDLSSLKIHRSDIDYIRVEVTDGNVNHFNLFLKESFFIRNGKKTKYDGKLCQVTERDGTPVQQGCSLEGGTAPTRGISKMISDGTSNEQWTLRYDDYEGSKKFHQFYDPEGQNFCDILASLPEGDGIINNTCGDDDDWIDVFAILVSFDQDGFLKKIRGVIYSDSNSENLTFYIWLGTHEKCLQLAETVLPSGENTAWTDRLWQYSQYAKSEQGVGGLGYKFSTVEKPYGSLRLTQEPSDEPITLYSRLEGVRLTPGAPWACPASNPADPNSHTFFQWGSRGCVGFDGKEFYPATQAKYVTLFPAINRLFAKVPKVCVWSKPEGESPHYICKKPDDFYPNRTDFNRTEKGVDNIFPTPPTVLAVGKCRANGKCEEGGVGVTVNDKLSGDLKSVSGFFPATLKFFAYADKNQMPIRSIAIDWGDGTVYQSVDSYYQNHRGLRKVIQVLTENNQCTYVLEGGEKLINLEPAPCSHQVGDYLEVCAPNEENASHFGQTPQACSSSYFRFDHNYLCVKNGPGWQSDCPDSRVTGGCCVFKPKVQVKDNWGWCNGSCPGDPGGGGCYDKSWYTDPVTRQRGTDECDVNDPAFNHWANFAGQIIVTPR